VFEKKCSTKVLRCKCSDVSDSLKVLGRGRKYFEEVFRRE
jgi:hypothetical protein